MKKSFGKGTAVSGALEVWWEVWETFAIMDICVSEMEHNAQEGNSD